MMTTHRTRSVAAALTLLLLGAATEVWSAQPTYEFNLPQQSLADALRAIGRQTTMNILFEPETVENLTAPAVRGLLSAEDAVKQVLSGTKLVVEQAATNSILVSPSRTDVDRSEERSRVDEQDKQTQAARQTQQTSELREIRGIPEVLVEGTRSLNMDIQRTEDDAQPYVVFGRAEIENSGTKSVEDFVRQRLTMLSGASKNENTNSVTGASSNLNLRGLGANQTLILVDGRRVADMNVGRFTVAQPNTNWIPMAAIERIEVLPATASGIYGGGATGGVVNIILRRDYTGAELKLSYEDSFSADAANRRFDFSTGFTSESGKTSLLMAATHARQDMLLLGARDFGQRGVDRIFANNPAYLLQGATPPVGATPNIRSVDGSNLVLRSGTALNSPITYIPSGYIGTASDGGAALVANAGQYNLNAPDSAQSTLNPGRRISVVRDSELTAGLLTLRHDLNDRINLFLDLSASNSDSGAQSNGLFGASYVIPAAAPNNPFNQAIRVTPPGAAVDSLSESSIKDRRVLGGALFKLSSNWNAEVDYSWQRSRLSYVSQVGLQPTVGAAIASGAVDVLRDPSLYDLSAYVTGPDHSTVPAQSTLQDFSFRVAGPIGRLPAGEPTLAAMVERRETELDTAIDSYPRLGVSAFTPAGAQDVTSVYMEARIPLISRVNAIKGVRALDMQLSARWDDYTTRGGTAVIAAGTTVPTLVSPENNFDSTSPTIALTFEPLDGLVLRASYGRGFLPPSTLQLTATPGLSDTVADPRRGNTPVTVNGGVTVGGNRNLMPETSESFSIGLIYTPAAIAGLRISLDRTSIKKSDNIASLTGQQLIDNEAIFSSRVVRGAPLPGDPAGWAGPIIALDETLANFASARIEAYDLQLDYQPAGRFDAFQLFTAVTWQPHYQTQFLPSSQLLEQVGIGAENPLEFRANAGLTWTHNAWTAGWLGQYFDSYQVSTSSVLIANQGNGGKVSSQHYHDVFVSYRFAESAGTGWRSSLLGGLKIQAGARNIFNSAPPFDANTSSSGYYSRFGDPRLASYYVSLTTSF